MERLLVLGVPVLTLLAAWGLMRALGTARGPALTALGGMLEGAGIIALCFAANVVVATLIVLAVRSLTETFVSAYVVNDVALLGLSVLQGLWLMHWRRRAP